MKDPEVQGMDLQMAAPVRTRNSFRMTTDKQADVLSTTSDDSDQLDQRRTSSEIESSMMARQKSQIKSAPVVGVATKMAPPRPSHSAQIPLSGPERPSSMLSGTSGVTPQD